MLIVHYAANYPAFADKWVDERFGLPFPPSCAVAPTDRGSLAHRMCVQTGTVTPRPASITGG